MKDARTPALTADELPRLLTMRTEILMALVARAVEREALLVEAAHPAVTKRTRSSMRGPVCPSGERWLSGE